jgi:histone H4
MSQNDTTTTAVAEEAPTTTKTRGAAKGKGKGNKRNKPKKDAIEGLTKPAIRRLARRAGVKRMDGTVYQSSREQVKTFLRSVVGDSIRCSDNARRKTVSSGDVLFALKRQGTVMYGF